MRLCADDLEIPLELQGEDVYDMFCIFDNEEEAIDYIAKEYKVDRNLLISELYEEDFLRNEFGKENYLRTASISLPPYLVLSELMNSEYILWEVY